MLKKKLFLLFSVTIFALASTILDIFNYNPFESGSSVFINFYVSLFFTLTGIIGFFIFYFKIKIMKGEWNHSLLFPSVRQASFLSLSLIVLLMLKGLDLLDWWVGIPLVIATILLEMYFQTSSPKISHQKKINKGKL